MNSGYLGRLIARAAPVLPRAVAQAPVADPFETAEQMPAPMPPPASSSEPSRMEPAPAHEPVSSESAPPSAMLAPEPTSIIERTIVRENIPVDRPVLEPAHTASYMPAAIPPMIPESPARIERVIEYHEREVIPSVSPEREPAPVTIEGGWNTGVERVIELEKTERIERIVSLQPKGPPAPIVPREPVAAAQAPIVQPRPAPAGEPMHAPAEPAGLSIGRLIVDVVPVPWSAPVAQNRRGARRSSRFQTSPDHFFGLGQI